MWSEDLVELENSLEAQRSDPWVDRNTSQQGDAITDGNFGRKPAEVRGITRVVASAKDDVLALLIANKEVETLCGFPSAQRKPNSSVSYIPRILLSALSLPGPTSTKSNKPWRWLKPWTNRLRLAPFFILPFLMQAPCRLFMSAYARTTISVFSTSIWIVLK